MKFWKRYLPHIYVLGFLLIFLPQAGTVPEIWARLVSVSGLMGPGQSPVCTGSIGRAPVHSC